jgi:hypothetical protein
MLEYKDIDSRWPRYLMMASTAAFAPPRRSASDQALVWEAELGKTWSYRQAWRGSVEASWSGNLDESVL